MKESKTLTFLFLGGAKRVAMAKYLADATRKEGYEPRFVSYELDRNCAIASIATVVEGLRWSDSNIIEHLAEVVNQYNVDVVIPFVDAAIHIATRLTQRCPSVFTPGANEYLQQMLFDKIKAADLFAKCGFPIPQTYVGEANDKVWIAKPRFGSASKGLVFLDANEVGSFDNSAEEYLIQECFKDREEISVDCYSWPYGTEDSIISPRKRLEVMGGEAIKTLTLKDEEVEILSRRILKDLNLTGAVTIQFLRDKVSCRLMLMEINPRLGGGCTASVMAGADIPRCIVRDALGRNPLTFQPRPDVLVCRYLSDIVIN